MKHTKAFIFIEIAAVLFYIVIGSVLLLGKPHVGMADSGDFSRITNMVGLQNIETNRFNQANRFFNYAPKEGAKIEYEFFSTQLIPLKVSEYLSNLIHGKTRYDIHALGFIYLLISAMGLFLLLDGIRRLFSVCMPFMAVITVFFFTDVGYLAYYNSFFGEAAMLSFALLFVGAAVFMISQKYMNLLGLAVLTAAAVLFVGSKEANAPSGVFITAFLLCLILLINKAYRIWMVVASAVIVITFSFVCYRTIPAEIRMINQYHTVFFGILKNSPTPEKDLADLGIDTKLSVLKGTTFYDKNLPYLQYGDELNELFYNKFSYKNILIYYLTHPARFYNKLQVTAHYSNRIRPDYLGNHEYMVNGRPSFETRFSLWSTVREKYFPRNLWFIIVLFLVYTIVTLFEGIKLYKFSDKRSFVLACLVMINIITAAIQFVIPILGDGEGDLDKHLFYYNVNYDFMLITSIGYITYKISAFFKGSIRLNRSRS